MDSCEQAGMNLFKFILLVFFWVTQVAISAASAAASQEGEASYYDDTLNGRKTANGEFYDKNALTAAHRSLPFGTRVKVTCLETGLSVEVVINDRGPYAKGRIIDLSSAAARRIGLLDAGHGKVRLEVVEP